MLSALYIVYFGFYNNLKWRGQFCIFWAVQPHSIPEVWHKGLVVISSFFDDSELTALLQRTVTEHHLHGTMGEQTYCSTQVPADGILEEFSSTFACMDPSKRLWRPWAI